MFEKNPSKYVGVNGLHDAVADNVVLCNVPSKMVYVANAADLDELGSYPMGTIAAQYGFKMLWQLGPDGWVEIFAQADTAEMDAQEAS